MLFWYVDVIFEINVTFLYREHTDNKFHVLNLKFYNYVLSRRVTHYCVVEDFNLLTASLCMLYRGHISSRFSCNSEAVSSRLSVRTEKHMRRHVPKILLQSVKKFNHDNYLFMIIDLPPLTRKHVFKTF